jgi:AcrR family transcriptional regulator
MAAGWNIHSNLYLCVVNKRDQIIQAAMELLVQQDTQATPMSAIAKAAKTGMGTIYNCFATKEELINAIFIHITTEQYQHVARDLKKGSVKSQFEHYYLGFNQYWLAHPTHFFFIDQFERSPIITPATRAENLAILEPILTLLLTGQHQGVLKSFDVQGLLAFLNGGILAFIRWVLVTQPGPHAALLQNQLKMAWDAIKE